MPETIDRLLFGLLLSIAAAGCSAPNSQLTACQQDKEQLLAAIREQRETGRTLKDQVASLETRLHQAETELARGTSGTRLSSLPTASAKTQSAKTPAAKPDSLPWRSPPKSSVSATEGKSSSNAGSQSPRSER